MNVSIQNYSIKQEPVIANRIMIRVAEIVFGTSAKFLVDFYNNEMLVKTDVSVDINEQEYKQWGTEDKYIINLICSKLGISKI